MQKGVQFQTKGKAAEHRLVSIAVFRRHLILND